MRFRRKGGWFRAVIAIIGAAFLAIGMLALPGSTQPPSTQPAPAQQGCTPNQPNGIPHWYNLHDERGVTLCRGEVLSGPPPEVPAAVLQIVDLEAGANVSLVSEAVDIGSGASTDNEFYKRLAIDWFDWIESRAAAPAPSRLFSTTNASFFTDTSGDRTALSLPQDSLQWPTDFPFPVANRTYGAALGDHDDPAWGGLKRALKIGNPGNTPQFVSIEEFPTEYDEADVEATFGGFMNPQCGGGDCIYGTVGFQPLYEISGPGVSGRTFVGVVPGSKMYILSLDTPVTIEDANEILQSFGSIMAIQLDGGGSTQMYAEGYVEIPSAIGRTVPDVLAVYLAPE
ncbi:phosphodiester glycosidase family protein [Phytoactinopolyspora mesophila]|uniref:Phosphodiester glycosidase domain-containing protein n=1 Tax=Phytoactinopolyspora mesophila TaxID=2650750 RepID=A0A7K3M963_9ACTN|nr:phosphodiester glycosidase family protein [Phytoactinopolyspora mesophila]NDL59517.1 hypothetical protein [Phytoactinopolyspora mesophila]